MIDKMYSDWIKYKKTVHISEHQLWRKWLRVL